MKKPHTNLKYISNENYKKIENRNIFFGINKIDILCFLIIFFIVAVVMLILSITTYLFQDTESLKSYCEFHQGKIIDSNKCLIGSQTYEINPFWFPVYMQSVRIVPVQLNEKESKQR